MLLEVSFKPHGPVSFRKPSDFSATAHGPAVSGTTLRYPMPSTLAGALAYIAYSSGLCKPKAASCWEDTLECLRALFGEDVKLYTGFAKIGDKLLYYTVHGYMDSSDMKEYGKCLVSGNGECLEKLYVKAIVEPQVAYTGIALKRHSKTVLPEHLYTITYLDPSAIGLEYIILIDGVDVSRVPQLDGKIVRLGGEGRTATLCSREHRDSIDDILLVGYDAKERQGCTEWLLYLVAPALLEESIWGESSPILLSEEHGKQLAYKLLKGIVNKDNIVKVYVPKTEPTVTILAPGWSLSAKAARRPHLYIPAGSSIHIKSVGVNTVKSIVQYGLGTHTEIGWGTIVAICVD